MANELLDFVMSLVRDPEAAARYAEDPTQAIADAHLGDVTSADVNSLIPVVSESLSMAAPGAGTDMGADSNVWTSGAATAAFDAFADHIPDQADQHIPDQQFDGSHQVITDMLDQPADTVAVDVSGVDAGELGQPDPAADFHIDDSAPVADDVQPVDHPAIGDHDLGADAHSFDIFD